MGALGRSTKSPQRPGHIQRHDEHGRQHHRHPGGAAGRKHRTEDQGADGECGMTSQEEKGDVRSGVACLGLVGHRRALRVKRRDANGGHHQIHDQHGEAGRKRGHSHPHGNPGRAERSNPAPSDPVTEVAEQRLDDRGRHRPGERREADHAVRHPQAHGQDGIEHRRPQGGKVRREVTQRDSHHGPPAGKDFRGDSTFEAPARRPGRSGAGGTFARQAYAPLARPACPPPPT